MLVNFEKLQFGKSHAVVNNCLIKALNVVRKSGLFEGLGLIDTYCAELLLCKNFFKFSRFEF